MTEPLASLSGEARADVCAALDACLRLPGAERAVIYGSYAKGTAHPGSDLDVALFFRDDGISLRDRYRAAARLCAMPEMDVQVQVFSVSELSDPCGIVEEIVQYGVTYTGT